MSKTLKICLLTLFIFGILAGVYYFFNPKKALNIIIPEINQVENIRIKLVGDTAYIDVDLRMENKSFFKLHIDSLIYQVNFDSATLLAKQQYLDLRLAHGEIDTIQLPVALPYKRLMKKIRNLQGQDSVDLRIDVRLVYATVFGRASIPYMKKFRIEVPHPPKIEVERMEYVKREKKTVFLLAHINVNNPGKLDLNISDVKYHLTVKDLLDAKGSEKKEMQIKPKSSLSVMLPIKVEFKSLFKALGLIITNKDKVKYHLKVTAFVQNDDVGAKKTPLEVESDGTLELRK